ncbi:MAG: DUF126 domain-containing protein [Rhizobiales bacterium]|nr:DUF126 domain-containing protein [Hyphomicrobiales bacterium]
MVLTLDAEMLVDGSVAGEILKLGAPICFWGGLDPKTGQIADPKHPDHGAVVSGKVLAIPRIVGSSSSSQQLLEVLYLGRPPAADHPGPRARCHPRHRLPGRPRDGVRPGADPADGTGAPGKRHDCRDRAGGKVRLTPP